MRTWERGSVGAWEREQGGRRTFHYFNRWGARALRALRSLLVGQVHVCLSVGHRGVAALGVSGENLSLCCSRALAANPEFESRKKRRTANFFSTPPLFTPTRNGQPVLRVQREQRRGACRGVHPLRRHGPRSHRMSLPHTLTAPRRRKWPSSRSPSRAPTPRRRAA